jgi:hypothetical protein
MKRPFSLILRAALAIVSPLLACFGCGGSRGPSSPPPNPKVRWRGEETGYQNTTQLQSSRRSDPATNTHKQETQEQ